MPLLRLIGLHRPLQHSYTAIVCIYHKVGLKMAPQVCIHLTRQFLGGDFRHRMIKPQLRVVILLPNSSKHMCQSNVPITLPRPLICILDGHNGNLAVDYPPGNKDWRGFRQAWRLLLNPNQLVPFQCSSQTNGSRNKGVFTCICHHWQPIPYKHKVQAKLDQVHHWQKHHFQHRKKQGLRNAPPCFSSVRNIWNSHQEWGCIHPPQCATYSLLKCFVH